MAKLTLERAVAATGAVRREQMRFIDEVVRSMPLTHLMCRAFQHPWNDPVDWRYDEELRRFYAPVDCRRCTTDKLRVMDRNGYSLPSPPWSYHYPDGYQHGEVNLITREGLAAVRREILRRMQAGITA